MFSDFKLLSFFKFFNVFLIHFTSTEVTDRDATLQRNPRNVKRTTNSKEAAGESEDEVKTLAGFSVLDFELKVFSICYAFFIRFSALEPSKTKTNATLQREQR